MPGSGELPAEESALIIGRDAGLARLRGLVDPAPPASRVLLVTGEAGMGKTVLLADTAERARAAGMRVLWVTGRESESRLAFAGLHQLLRPVLPNAAALPGLLARALLGALGLSDPGAADRLLTGVAVLTLLSDLSEQSPVVVVADDAHWLDRSSLDVLAFAGSRLDAERVVLLAGARGQSIRPNAGWWPLAKQFRMRGVTLHLGRQCTKVEDSGSELTVHFGDGETVMADLMLVSAGRGPVVEGLGLEGIGVEFDRQAGIATDPRRRTTVPHIYAVGDCAGHWQLAHTAFREGEVAARNASGHQAVVGNRAVPRPIYTEPEIASVGLTEKQARRQYGDDVATGLFPWVANARAVMQNEHAGWVKSIHETRSGRLLGLVMVGPHVTDIVEAGVIAIDAGVTIETVADGMAPHPTLSEAIRGAGLVALGRAVDVPNRNRLMASR
jgi:Pyridine nucleotide-disulphide oxidoreductase, dimerisation domain/Pyridine nucleotide-disulphide oxidoreductase/AAA ATPase domain